MPDVYEIYEDMEFAREHFSGWVAFWFDKIPYWFEPKPLPRITNSLE